VSDVATAPGVGWVRRRFENATAGAAILPLVVLFFLYFFDEFDTAGLGTLAPEIKHAFHLTDKDIAGLVLVNLSVILLLSIPVGYLGDRLPRKKIIVVSAVVAGVFSFATGLAFSVGLLVAFRLGNGVGLLANDPVHRSFLTDTYEPGARPGVFALHANAMRLGSIAGPLLAGGVAAVFNWRVAFMILVVPILFMAVQATRLREPLRGATDDPTSAELTQAQRHTPFRHGVRILSRVPTLRRQFMAWLFIGAGLVPLAFEVPLYFEKVFHLGPAARGLIGALGGVAAFAGVQRGGKWTPSWMARGLGEPLKLAGLALMAVGPLLVVSALSPWLGLAVVLAAGAYFAFGVAVAPFVAAQAMVSPARVRTLSFSFGILFIVAGVWALYYVPGVAGVSDHYGHRWGIAVLGPYWVIGGLLLWSAAKFVTGDATRAVQSLAALSEARRHKSSTAQAPVLAVRDLDVGYDQTQVLFGVSLDVARGEILALLGTNGAGKSTLLKAISGLAPPSAGSVLFEGEDIVGSSPGQVARLGIAQVPGGRGIFPSLTVGENLRSAGWLYRKDKGYLEDAVGRVLRYFPILEQRWDTAAGSLSGGEQQMLSLSQAFIARPKLLMIDELSLGLAPTIVDRLLEIVRAIHAGGTTVVLVEQSVNVALRLAERAVFMEKGEIRFSGPTAELLDRTDILRAVFLRGAQAGSTNGDGSAGSKRRVPAQARRADAKRRAGLLDQPVLLETWGLTKRYGGVRAVDQVDLQLHEGQILGLIGPNGAGKTTIFDIISGFTPPDGGRVRFLDIDVTRWPAWRRAELGLARSFQDARLWPSLTVKEALAVSMRKQSAVTSPLPAFLGLPPARDSEAFVDDRVEELIALLGLQAFRDKFVSELSTGSRRIVEIASLVSNDPKVIVLDEPSSGIAQREAEALGPMLREVQSYTDCSILLIEHDMPLISSLADHIVALELGAVIARGTPDEVLENPRVVESYLGNTTYGELRATAGGARRGARARSV
jgi:branched-chain amino acid transport system ATP-binding protein